MSAPTASPTTPPTTSVLLPARDAEATLAEALASVLAQTDRDLEVLLVDDGSRDRTAAIARDFAARDARVRVIDGMARGLIAGLELARSHARGRLLLRMDADDVTLPERLAAERALLDSDERVACASCFVESFAAGPVQLGRRQYDAWLNAHVSHDSMARARFVESPVAHPSVLLRADAVAAVGGYRQLPGPEDWDLWLRLFHAGWRFAKVPRVLLRWREHEGRTSRVDPRYGSAGFTHVRARHLAAGPLRERPAVLCGAGKGGAALAKALLAEGARVLAFLDVAPRRVGGAKAGVPVLALDEAPRLAKEGLLLGAAGGRGARAALRATLRAAGLVEGRDFFLAV